MSDKDAKGNSPTARPPKKGMRCPRCHRSAPNIYKCLLCNPDGPRAS